MRGWGSASGGTPGRERQMMISRREVNRKRNLMSREEEEMDQVKDEGQPPRSQPRLYKSCILMHRAWSKR
jgi:hypothetical protein